MKIFLTEIEAYGTIFAGPNIVASSYESKKIFQRIKSQASHGTAAGKWSARKAQALAKAYKKAGGGYK